MHFKRRHNEGMQSQLEDISMISHENANVDSIKKIMTMAIPSNVKYPRIITHRKSTYLTFCKKYYLQVHL